MNGTNNAQIEGFGHDGVFVHAVESTRLKQGGPAQSVPRLANALFELGTHVAIVCPDHDGSSTQYANLKMNCYRTWEEMRTHFPNARIQVLHLHGLWNPFQHRLAKIARRNEIPYVFSPRGMLEPWSLNHKRWKKRIAWWLYQKRDLQLAAMLHATAASEMNQFRKLGLENPVAVVPNGVEVPELPPRTMPRDAKVRNALFLGRIHPKKGLLMLADAWSKVRPIGWRMRVVGPDSDGHLQQVRDRVRMLGIESEWEFSDAQYGDDKSHSLSGADLFVLPTYSENFGIAIAEALAHGVPVLTTTGTPWQSLATKGCGWWIEPTIEGLAAGLSQAVELSPESLRTMGQQGRIWMQTDFAWPTIAAAMLEAYFRIPGVKAA